MFSIELDIRTLSFITVLFAFGSGAGLIAFSLAYGVFRGLKFVGLGLLGMGAGFLCIGLRGVVPAAISVVLGNTLLLAGFVAMNGGIQRFRRLPPSGLPLGIASVAATAVLFVANTYVHPSVSLRILWLSLCLALLSAMCLRSMFRGSGFEVRTPQWLVGSGFAFFVAFSLFRGWWALAEPGAGSFMAAGMVHGLAFLAMILLMLFIAFGLVWMANAYLQAELSQYEAIIATTPDAIALVDRAGHYRLVNDATLEMLGLQREDVLGKTSLDLFGREFYETVTRPSLETAFRGGIAKASMWADHPDGQRKYVALTYHPVPGSMGKDSAAAIHVMDMTQLHLAQEEKQRVFDLSLDMLCIAGFDGYFKEANPAWTSTLGWTEEELLQARWLDFVHPDDVQETVAASIQLAEGKPVVDFVNRYRTKDGGYKHISWMSYPDNDAQLIYAVARDVTDRIRMEEDLRELAAKDPLTNADNRRTFMRRLGEEVERSTRYAIPLSVLAMDIDHFKSINDTYGHAAGDEVLMLCVASCVETLRTTDIFGRVGGEEFSVALPHTGLDTACETAERLRRSLEECEVESEQGPIGFTVSIGVAELQPEESMEDLLKRADEALYRAKQAGRNRVEKA